MARKILITEAQLNAVIKEQYEKGILEESFKMGNIKTAIDNALKYGVASAAIIGYLMAGNYLSNQAELDKVKQYTIEKEKEMKMFNDVRTSFDWKLVANDVHATVYNAEPGQCDADCGRTASMFRLNLNDVGSHRIIAMERTFMASLGLKYGDVVKIEGTGKYDGVWQIQDTMNKRFAGQKKIDILVPKSNGLGQWTNVKMYILNNPQKTEEYKQDMAPQLSPKAFAQQNKIIKSGKYKAI